MKVWVAVAAGVVGMGVMVGCVVRKEEPPKVPLPAVSPGAPRHFDVGDLAVKYELPEDAADGYVEVARAPQFSYGLTVARRGLSARRHDRSDMVIYVHSGAADFQVGERAFVAATGDLIYVPRGAVYRAECRDARRLELVTVYSPPLDPGDVTYAGERGR